MIEFFVNIDHLLFHFFNSGMVNPVFDTLMPFITEVRHWIPVYLIMFFLIFYRRRKSGILISLALIITVGLTNEINSEYLKDLFARPRPCHITDDIRLLVNCGPGKSFPSSHAANSFAMAAVLTYYFRKLWWVFVILASAVAFSRVYIGVHYPADIFAGALVGIIIAATVILLFNSGEKLVKSKYSDKNKLGKSEHNHESEKQ